MDSATKALKGSPFRDAVKYWHKHFRDGNQLYAIDNDLMLIENHSVIVACLDVKKPGNGSDVKWSHQQLYDWFESKDIPVYFISPLDYKETKCDECGKVDIEIDSDSAISVIRYSDGLTKTFANQDEYVRWEKKLRQRIKKSTLLKK